MKKMKRIAIIMMAMMMVVSMMGCGKTNSKAGGKGSDEYAGRKEIEIKYLATGQGVEWLEKAMDAFNKKQSEYYVYYSSSVSLDVVLAAFGEPDIDTVDLYAIHGGYHDVEYMEPLDDVLNATADGDKVALKDKFADRFLDMAVASDGKYYTLPITEEMMGIVYNKKMFQKAGIEETPRTTKELEDACELLMDAGVTPWIHFKNGGYYEALRNVWQSQYDGYDYYYHSFGKLTDGTDKDVVKKVLTQQDGRYQAIRVLGNLLTHKTVVAGSNSQDHVTAQTMFLNQDIGMMVNGSWLSNEMESVAGVDDFEVMRYPVISSITDKLATVKTDRDLRNLVSAIDSVTNGEKDIATYKQEGGYLVEGTVVSTEDWDYVASARNSVSTGILNNGFFIPTYTDMKDGAKEFLKFFYSDEWCYEHMDILKQTCALDISDTEYDFENWNNFEKSFYELTNKSDKYISAFRGKNLHILFKDRWTDDVGLYDFIPDLCSPNASDRKTADDIWEIIVGKLEGRYDAWLKDM